MYNVQVHVELFFRGKNERKKIKLSIHAFYEFDTKTTRAIMFFFEVFVE